MRNRQQRARRATEHPPSFDIFSPSLDRETTREFAVAWAAEKSGTEPDHRSAAVLWNLINTFPPDEIRVHRVPQEVGDLISEWRDALEGRPEWSFGPRAEEEQ